MTNGRVTQPNAGARRAQRLLRPSWYVRHVDDQALSVEDASAHFEAFGLRDGRSPCALFDAEWYATRAGDRQGLSPIEHYLTSGASQGLDPSPVFDSEWYVAQIDGPLPPGVTPLEHFIDVGSERGLDPHPLFKTLWYRSTYPEVELDGLTAVEDFMDLGWTLGRDPSPLFSAKAYLQLNPDIGQTNPLVHYICFGMREGRPSASVFDDRAYVGQAGSSPAASFARSRDQLRARVLRLFRASHYTTINPGIAESHHTPIDHYQLFGFADRLEANVLFDSTWYRKHMPDLGPDVHPLEHYLTVGARDGMTPSVAFDVSWYLRQLGHDLPPDCTPVEHYVHIGWAMGLDPHPLFSGAWYIERNGVFDLGGLTPYEHFLQFGWAKGYEPGPMFNASAYCSLNDDVDLADQNAFIHYISEGFKDGRPTSYLFDEGWYLKQASDDPLSHRFQPLAHYIHFGSPIGRRSSPDPLAAALAEQRMGADRRSRASLVGSVEIDDRGIETQTTEISWDSRVELINAPSTDDPLVSVVIPTYNHFEDVTRCIESISTAGDAIPLEIILVDDASDDQNASRFRSINGIRLIRLHENEGFAGACTAGVAASRGAFILLLNNDTEVLPGWIDGLIEEMDTHPGTGVVGSMIVRPDLRLQEAGAVMWADGDAAQYGSGHEPVDFRYRFRREVDYCSGASLLIRREVWDHIGGFDPQFSPAYYEDADVCFAARQAGWVVAYQPKSVLFHNEGSSHGTDGAGTKKYQFRNKERFRKKWELSLFGHGYAKDAADGIALLRLRDRRRSNHVVVIDHRVPARDQDAGSLRMYRIIELLIGLGHVVHFLPADRARHQPYTQELEDLGVEFITGDDPDMVQHLRAISSMTDFVLVSRPEVLAQRISFVLEALPTVPVVFDMVDAHAQRIRRSAAMSARPELESEALRLERLETAAARLADVVVVVSQADEDFITDLARVPLSTVRIPTIHFAEDPGPTFDERDGLLFVGGFEHPPNLDAALFLVHDILPLVRDRLGDVRLTLAGSKPPQELVRLSLQNVTVTGWVAQLRPLYDRARVSVAPLRFGAGVKGKIGEALSFGVPTVTTSIGVEGIDLRIGADILVADDAAGFADRIVEAYLDRPTWEALRTNGAAAIERQFGRDAATTQIESLVRAAALVDRRPDHRPSAG